MRNPYAVVLVVFVCLFAIPAQAEWTDSATEGTPIRTATGVSRFPKAIPDGFGGSIVAWMDERDGFGFMKVYAQRIDSDGVPLWTPEGVRASGVVLVSEGNVRVSGNGNGGIYVTFALEVGANAYRHAAQFVDASGTPRWGTDGLLVDAATSTAFVAPPITVLDSGDAVITWSDARTGTSKAYAQRIDPAGNLQWTVGGVEVSTHPSAQTGTNVVGLPNSSVLVFWGDDRNLGTTGTDLFMQRLRPNGTRAWDPAGELLTNAAGTQQSPQAVLDSDGGVIVSWADFRNADEDIYAARILGADGNKAWEVPISTATGRQGVSQIAADGSGGAIVAWEDYRAGTRVYAQRVDFAGLVRWEIDGLELTLTSGLQSPRYQGTVSDQNGGIFFTFSDWRWGNSDIYAQRVDASGNRMWGTGGAAVCRQVGSQSGVAVVPDGRGGMVAVWSDQRRLGFDYQMYAQRLDPFGNAGDPGPRLDSAVDFPQDQGGRVVLGWGASTVDTATRALVDYYSVWRRLASSAKSAPGFLSRLSSTDSDASRHALLASAGWSLLGTVPAAYLDRYGFDADTYGDSTANDVVHTDFLVIAEGVNAGETWASGTLTATSVDNLTPGVPQNFVGALVVNDAVLSWSASGIDDEDLAGYRVYAGATPDFTANAGSLVGQTTEDAYVDPGVSGPALYYRVSAVDIHGNESAPTAAVPVLVVTAVTPGADSTVRLGAHPNPFNPSTRLRYTLPEMSAVDLSVYDLAGRHVRTLYRGTHEAGDFEVSWRGRDERGRRLASGVYFAVLVTEAGTVRRKITMVK